MPPSRPIEYARRLSRRPLNGIPSAVFSSVMAMPMAVLVLYRLFPDLAAATPSLALITLILAVLGWPLSVVALAAAVTSLSFSCNRLNAAWFGVVAALFPTAAIIWFWLSPR